MEKGYDYLLKVLLVGDSDVGKTEILNNFEAEDNEGEFENKSSQ
jgi:GTPase SAR1 family protein